MPLDTADTFTDTPPTDDDTAAAVYPPPPSLAPLSFLLGYTESNRARYTRIQTAAAARLLSLPLTPTEVAGLAYYDGTFYAYESYGDVLGSSAGALLGLALRARKPGRIPSAIARTLNVSARVVAVAMRVAIFGSLGRLYGMTTAGVQALNRMRREQKTDPNMERVVAARARKIDALERELRAKAFGRHPQPRRGGEGQGEERDEQSLGGMEEFEKERGGEDAFPFGRPSELVAAQQQPAERQSEGGDDPFSLADEQEAHKGAAPVKGGWRNTHSSTGESTWERLRKGQQPVGGSGDEQQSQSPWPRRQPMKGFGSSPQSDEPKTDSFSFSSSAEDRELAKAQAQREFDESLERERRSGGGAEGGEGYSEGDQRRGGRGGRW